jgi:hypothetical protein
MPNCSQEHPFHRSYSDSTDSTSARRIRHRLFADEAAKYVHVAHMPRSGRLFRPAPQTHVLINPVRSWTAVSSLPSSWSLEQDAFLSVCRRCGVRRWRARVKCCRSRPAELRHAHRQGCPRTRRVVRVLSMPAQRDLADECVASRHGAGTARTSRRCTSSSRTRTRTRRARSSSRRRTRTVSASRSVRSTVLPATPVRIFLAIARGEVTDTVRSAEVVPG